MKSTIVISILIFFCWSCRQQNSELVGVPDKKMWTEKKPKGMVFVPMGSFNMECADNDTTRAVCSQNIKTVSIDPFWMDETEITNAQYRKFVDYVRDSTTRRRLLKAGFEQFRLPLGSEDIDDLNNNYLNYKVKIDWKSEDYNEALASLFVEKNGVRVFDTRKLIYEYYWVDLRQAAKRANRYDFHNKKYRGDTTKNIDYNRIVKRASFIMKGTIAVYPDTMVWQQKYNNAFNDPLIEQYFSHKAFDKYPVVGISWKLATAYCIWRTQIENDMLSKKEKPWVQDYRLPTESEWAYTQYSNNEFDTWRFRSKNDFINQLKTHKEYQNYTPQQWDAMFAQFAKYRLKHNANLSGSDDGFACVAQVTSYKPNNFGLYDMEGNVAEWTSNAYTDSVEYKLDLNPDYTYNAVNEDSPVLKRKVIRGGSWWHEKRFAQRNVRSFDYQDSARAYIGFRCVRSYMGRDGNDWNVNY